MPLCSWLSAGRLNATSRQNFFSSGALLSRTSTAWLKLHYRDDLYLKSAGHGCESHTLRSQQPSTRVQLKSLATLARRAAHHRALPWPPGFPSTTFAVSLAPDLCSVPVNSPVLDIPYKWTQRVAFCVWHFT